MIDTIISWFTVIHGSVEYWDTLHISALIQVSSSQICNCCCTSNHKQLIHPNCLIDLKRYFKCQSMYGWVFILFQILYLYSLIFQVNAITLHAQWLAGISQGRPQPGCSWNMDRFASNATYSCSTLQQMTPTFSKKRLHVFIKFFCAHGLKAGLPSWCLNLR
jgi:hypothetical protein